METLDYTKLRILREEKGITQEKMGELLFMTQGNYSKIEKGHKKIDSLEKFKKLAEVLEMPLNRLLGILAGEENIQSSGMPISELWQVEQLLKNEPLRKDEFVLFSMEVTEPEKYDFKEEYSGLNMAMRDESDPFPYEEYPPVMNIITGIGISIGFEFEKKRFKTLSVWLGDKKLGVVPEHKAALAHHLINELMISRVVLIENVDGIPGFFDTYMKVVFIATNAVNKKSNIEKARFTKVEFMSAEEVERSNNEAFEAELEQE